MKEVYIALITAIVTVFTTVWQSKKTRKEVRNVDDKTKVTRRNGSNKNATSNGAN